MAFSVSPSVEITEKDLTTSIPNLTTNNGCIVGNFAWGPVLEPVKVSREDELAKIFGKPTNTNYKDWFAAASFLSYSSSLWVVRVVDANAANATQNGTAGVVVKNLNDFNAQYTTLAGGADHFIARYPGAAGNSITVEVVDATGFGAWQYKNLFDAAPDAANNELAVVVLFNGIPVENYLVSTTPGAKDADGNNIYIEDVINNQSQYIYVIETVGQGGAAPASLLSDVGAAGGHLVAALSGGADGNAPVVADYQAGWDVVANPQNYDITYLIQGGAPAQVGVYMIQNIAEVRKDCVAFVSPAEVDVVNAGVNTLANLRALRQTGGAYNVSSSYGFLDGNYKYMYDKYNDTYRWVPLNGDTAGLAAQTSSLYDPWWSPAGYNRGHVKGVVKLAWNPTKADRDELALLNINPVINETGQGTVLFNDKTMLSKPSAFADLNVRMLFITIEKAIATAAKFLLFEFNDAFTRARFVNMVEPYLRSIKARRGIYDFRVVCDETNNTPQIIDSNAFVGDIYIKPSRVIRTIQLNFVAVRSGVDFKEIAGA